MTQRVSSNACGAPVRDRGAQCRAIAWSLFAISITFVALRFLSRSKMMEGPGFGADDWTILVVLAFMFPHEIGLELSECRQDLEERIPSFLTDSCSGTEWARQGYVDDCSAWSDYQPVDGEELHAKDR